MEQALIDRFCTPGKVTQEFVPRLDNGFVVTSHKYSALVRNHDLKQELITPYCPQQDGMDERVIRSIKEQRSQCRHATASGMQPVRSATGPASA